MAVNSKWIKSSIALFLALLMTLTFVGCSPSEDDLEGQIKEAVKNVKELNETATVGSVGGDWVVKGFCESGTKVDDEFYQAYYDDVRATVKSQKGIIDENYYTSNARVVIGVCAIGKNPKNIEGYDIVKPLDNYKKVINQGNNAVAFSLIASNVAGYKLSNEEKYIDILLEDIMTNKSYKSEKIIDYATMSIEALSYYMDRAEVKKAVDKAVEGISKRQEKDGSYGNLESTVEAIIALTSIGINPMSDERFTKDGNNLYEGLMVYRTSDGFKHIIDDDEIDPMATEKALLALDSMKLLKEGKKLYESK